MSVPAQIAALLDGRLDVGFVRPPVVDAALNSEIVISEPFLVALPPKHRFASRSRLQLSALADEPFVLPPRDAVPVFHAAVLRAVALVPASARELNRGRVIYRTLRPSPDNLEPAIAWRREDTSATLGEFISAARRSLRDLRA